MRFQLLCVGFHVLLTLVLLLECCKYVCTLKWRYGWSGDARRNAIKTSNGCMQLSSSYQLSAPTSPPVSSTSFQSLSEVKRENFFKRRQNADRSFNNPLAVSLQADQNLPPNFRSGFVTILGNPNVGKSTLLNAIIGEKLSIISPKPQTTRHRIFGILNDNESQVIFSDTPGLLNPVYPLQQTMLDVAKSGSKDAEVILLVTDTNGEQLVDQRLADNLAKTNIPMIVAINKVDTIVGRNDTQQREDKLRQMWKERYPKADLLLISALKNMGIQVVVELIKSYLPHGPRYYSDDQLSTRSERFHASEVIRESIFEIYKEEIPYCCHVRIDHFKDVNENLSTIDAVVCVSRKSQKLVVEGHNGFTLNKLRSSARIKLEQFLGRKVYLTLKVDVDEDWRKKSESLKRYGYILK